MAVAPVRLPTLLLALVLAFAVPALAQMTSAELVEALSTGLGMSDEQARRGAGAILRLAEARLGPAEFSMVEDAAPGARDLLAAAPAVGTSSAAGGLAPLTEAFALLGISPELIPQFAEVVIGYVRSGGGEPVARLLQRALVGG